MSSMWSTVADRRTENNRPRVWMLNLVDLVPYYYYYYYRCKLHDAP